MKKTTCKHCGRNILKGNICKNCKGKKVKIGAGVALLAATMFGEKGKEAAKEVVKELAKEVKKRIT